MAKLYDLHVKAPAELITPILELLDGTQGCVVSFDGQQKPPVEKPNHKRKSSPRTSAQQDFFSGMNTVVFALYQKGPSGTPVEASWVGNLMRTFGFASNSHTPALSRIVNLGYAIRPYPSTYQLTTKGIEYGKLVTEKRKEADETRSKMQSA